MATPQGVTPKKCTAVRNTSFHPELQETLFTWKFENLNLKMANTSRKLDSPLFSIDPIDATRMFLRVVPLSDDNKSMSVQLHRANDNGPTIVTLRYKYEILDCVDPDGQLRTITTPRGIRDFCLKTYRLPDDHIDRPIPFTWKRELFDPRKQLVIRCHILPWGEAPQSFTEKGADYLANLALSLELVLLYQDGTCSDVVVCAGEEKFNAHRSILCTRSPTFAKELEKYPSDSQTIELKTELDAPVLQALLKYLYCGRLANEIPAVDSDMYGAAVKYQVADLKWKLYAFPKKSSAHTTVFSEVKTFNWTINGFGDLETMNEVSSPLFDLVSRFSCTFQLILSISESADIPVDDHITPNVNISVHKVSLMQAAVSVYLKLSVIDEDRKLDLFCSDYHLFDRAEAWQFPPFLNTNRMLAHRFNYLPNKTLTLLCEFIVSDGRFTTHAETINLDTFLQNPEDLRSFARDILDLYTYRNFSDVMLRAVNGQVPAHKAILIARCPILKRCFQNVKDLKEIQLATTMNAINKMLYYLYSGGDYPRLEDYKVAIELHLLSKDLSLLNLQEYCKEYMISVVCPENVMKILEFAEGHHEARMSVWLEDFIHTHRKEVDEAARLELNREYQRRNNEIIIAIKKCNIL